MASELAESATPEFSPTGETKCKVKASQDKPLIVEWPSADRAQLEALVTKGVAVARYDGCEMQLLSRCRAPGEYTYVGVTPKRDSVRITNEDELWASVPIGAAKLEAKLRAAGTLTVNMTMVGRLEAPTAAVKQTQLSGECAGATHTLGALTVGAFEFFAGGEAEVGGGAEFAGVGAGAKSAAKRETLYEDGNAAECGAASEDKGPPKHCGAVIRVETVPIEGIAKASTLGGKPQGVVRARPAVTRGNCPAGMAFLEGGKFWMGSREGGNNERKVHQRTLKGYCIDVTEVTVEAFTKCVEGGACAPPQNGERCNFGQANRGEHPINCVDWGTAKSYCSSIDKRLPTEAEWEFAARGQEGRRYPWGADAPGLEHTNASSAALVGGRPRRPTKKTTTPVGSFPLGATPEGVLDLAGNVEEWTGSRQCRYSDLTSCSRDLVVVRGGSWSTPHKNMLTGYRRASLSVEANDPHSRLGFRCAMALPGGGIAE